MIKNECDPEIEQLQELGLSSTQEKCNEESSINNPVSFKSFETAESARSRYIALQKLKLQECLQKMRSLSSLPERRELASALLKSSPYLKYALFKRLSARQQQMTMSGKNFISTPELQNEMQNVSCKKQEYFLAASQQQDQFTLTQPPLIANFQDMSSPMAISDKQALQDKSTVQCQQQMACTTHSLATPQKAMMKHSESELFLKLLQKVQSKPCASHLTQAVTSSQPAGSFEATATELQFFPSLEQQSAVSHHPAQVDFFHPKFSGKAEELVGNYDTDSSNMMLTQLTIPTSTHSSTASQNLGLSSDHSNSLLMTQEQFNRYVEDLC